MLGAIVIGSLLLSAVGLVVGLLESLGAWLVIPAMFRVGPVVLRRHLDIEALQSMTPPSGTVGFLRYRHRRGRLLLVAGGSAGAIRATAVNDGSGYTLEGRAPLGPLLFFIGALLSGTIVLGLQVFSPATAFASLGQVDHSPVDAFARLCLLFAVAAVILGLAFWFERSRLLRRLSDLQYVHRGARPRRIWPAELRGAEAESPNAE